MALLQNARIDYTGAINSPKAIEESKDIPATPNFPVESPTRYMVYLDEIPLVDGTHTFAISGLTRSLTTPPAAGTYYINPQTTSLLIGTNIYMPFAVEFNAAQASAVADIEYYGIGSPATKEAIEQGTIDYLESKNVYYKNNKLAIGTSTGTATFHVYNATSPSTISCESGNREFELNVENDENITMGSVSNCPFELRTNSATRIYIDSDGKIGMGTSSPSRKLHLYSATLPSNVWCESRNRNFELNVENDEDITIGSTSSCGLNIQVNSTNRIYIASDGKIGFGNAAPDNTLSVGINVLPATTRKGITYGAEEDTCFALGQDTSHSLVMSWMYNATASSAEGTIGTYGYSNPIKIDGSSIILQSLSSGNVGIGKTPSYKLDIDLTTNDFAIEDCVADTDEPVTQQYQLRVRVAGNQYYIPIYDMP